MANPPKMTTMGLAVDTNGDIWQYQGANGMVQIGVKNGTPVLGAQTSMNSGDALATGWWILVDRAVGTDPASLLYSDGTATMPFNGDAYTLTFS